LLLIGTTTAGLAFSLWWWADWGWAYGLSGTVSGLWGLAVSIFFLVRALRRQRAENRGETVPTAPQLLKGTRVITVQAIGGWERPKVPAGSVGTVVQSEHDWSGQAGVLFIVPMGSWGNQQIVTTVRPEEVEITEA
jgi:hypothetical protein